jgi:hypothetical protein
MSKAILYPFKINKDFRIGYAWSAELARRLNRDLSLFTTYTSPSSDATVEIYNALVDAQGFYVKSFKLLEERLRPVKSERHFLRGEFDATFLDFVYYKYQPGIIVLQSDLLGNDLMKNIIKSGFQIIVLASGETPKTQVANCDRLQLFLTLLRHAACYNIPQSVFNSIGNDRLLFNAIASLFRK